MIFNSTDFLARLQNGENADSIAAQFTEALNKAQKDYKAKQEADRLAKEAAIAKREKQMTYAKKTADAINEMFAACWPDCAEEYHVKGEDIIDITESILKTHKLTTNVDKVFSDFFKAFDI